nr:heavy metal-binding domain-containing protein [uncultured Carboxylicivirga sp.]
MKQKVNFSLVITLITMSLIGISCNNASKKSNNETQKEMEHIVYTCPMHPEVEKSEPGKCPTCGMNLVKKDAMMKHSDMQMNDTIYTCPMHAEVELHEMGSCPKCGMDLVIKENNMEHSHEGHNHD